ncbi:GNAT family N-acetyltransferase [Caulobacter sp. BK020]|uniref:GNAT family N-acetyltransferase n=1 Tax=Caulobacter sp. BK020 TaxID=2512117 RepID=UPI00104A1A59|nr:GNAT family N-acetyltransferase [Caulobacter sp. BK020]TCS16124.1 acetyltransferase (GNAT) family protein [Caulobacter sp. BK020]
MTTSPPEREDLGASRLEDARTLQAGGPIRIALRPEVEADAAFRLALFRTSRGPGWDQLPLPADMLAQIMEQQFHAQTQGYRAAYPRARLEIVTVNAEPVGRLATDRSADALHLIDIAVVPERRGQGIGGAILRALMDEAAAAGRPVTLQVARDNLAAQRLYHRLGFALTGADETYLTLCSTTHSQTPSPVS